MAVGALNLEGAALLELLLRQLVRLLLLRDQELLRLELLALLLGDDGLELLLRDLADTDTLHAADAALLDDVAAHTRLLSAQYGGCHARCLYFRGGCGGRDGANLGCWCGNGSGGCRGLR